MKLFKSPAFISATISFLVMLVVIGILAYLFIPRESDNKLLPMTKYAIEDYDITIIEGAHVVPTRIINAFIRFADSGTPYYEKYKALLDKGGLNVILTSSELFEMSYGTENDMELFKSVTGRVISMEMIVNYGPEIVYEDEY